MSKRNVGRGDSTWLVWHNSIQLQTKPWLNLQLLGSLEWWQGHGTHLATSSILCRSSAVTLSGSFLRISTKSSSTAWNNTAWNYGAEQISTPRGAFEELNTATTSRLQENISIHCCPEVSLSKTSLLLIFEKN